jgi:hypothetical protein
VITDRHSSTHRALSSLDETFVGSVATLVAPADEIVLNRPDENVTEAERGDVVQIRRVLRRQTLNCSYEAELRVDLRCHLRYTPPDGVEPVPAVTREGLTSSCVRLRRIE